MNTLVQSSEKTLLWLSKIREIVEKNPLLIYNKEGKYWASFKNTITNKNIVYLHPQKNQIRLFTQIDPINNNILELTPSTGRWKKHFPSIFIIRNEDRISFASNLIIKSYSVDYHI
jgi:hypothetical protein